MKRQAFTLIELLVVIVIIGILAAFLMGPLMKARERAKVATANTAINGMKVALMAYLSDNGEFPADQCSNWTDGAVVDISAAGVTYLRQLRTLGTNCPYYAPQSKDTISPSTDNELLLDPWRKPYVYVLAPQRRGLAVFKTFPGRVGEFNMFSLGPNKRCDSCGAFLGGADPHDTTAAASGATSQKHIGGTSSATSDDPRNW